MLALVEARSILVSWSNLIKGLLMGNKFNNLCAELIVKIAVTFFPIITSVASDRMMVVTPVHCLPHTFWTSRKFADIGNTVRLQFQTPSYHMSAGWAGLVTCHALPGPGVIKALGEQGVGCVVVTEMSSEGTLTTPEYTEGG